MPNVSIEGQQGKGKTLTMVERGLHRIKEHPDYELYSNIKLYNLDLYAKAIGYQELNYIYLKKPQQLRKLIKNEKLDHAVLLLDEFHLWFPYGNDKIFQQLARETRKDWVDAYFTGHHAGTLNKWLRRVLTYRVLPDYNDVTGWCKYYIYKFDFIIDGDPITNPRVLGKFARKDKFFAPNYFQFFNTREKVKE